VTTKHKYGEQCISHPYAWEPCPYCRIEQLTAEKERLRAALRPLIDEYRAIISDNQDRGIDFGNDCVSIEISYLAQLAETLTEKESE
jgi:hypothetical protein